MKKRTVRHKEQRDVRRWGKNHKDEIFNKFDYKCSKCGFANLQDLEVHHKEYKIGIEYVDVLCSKCHHDFHKQELLLRLLKMFKKNAIRSKEEYGIVLIEDYINNLTDEIRKLEEQGVYVIPNVHISGLPKEEII